VSYLADHGCTRDDAALPRPPGNTPRSQAAKASSAPAPALPATGGKGASFVIGCTPGPPGHGVSEPPGGTSSRVRTARDLRTGVLRSWRRPARARRGEALPVNREGLVPGKTIRRGGRTLDRGGVSPPLPGEVRPASAHRTHPRHHDPRAPRSSGRAPRPLLPRFGEHGAGPRIHRCSDRPGARPHHTPSGPAVAGVASKRLRTIRLITGRPPPPDPPIERGPFVGSLANTAVADVPSRHLTPR
jgi:hypothetical protein